MLWLICGYASQSGRSFKKPPFYNVLKREWDMHCAGDLVMCLGDFNKYVCRHIDGFGGVHRWYGVG